MAGRGRTLAGFSCFTADHRTVVVGDSYTMGDDVLYLLRAPGAKLELLYGAPMENRQPGVSSLGEVPAQGRPPESKSYQARENQVTSKAKEVRRAAPADPDSGCRPGRRD